MRVSIDSLNSAHQDIMEPIIDSFEHLLPSWVDSLVIAYDDDNPGGAACAPYKPYRRVCVFVSKELLSEDTDRIERYVAHEFAHAYNEGILRVIHEYLPLLGLDDEVAKLFHKVVLDSVEEQTEDLAILFCREECYEEEDDDE